MINKQEKKLVKILHLYPHEMNIYGDLGNIITLKQRLVQRGYEVEYLTIDKEPEKGSQPYPEADIYFMGGGQDNDMFKVYEDLLKYKAEFIKSEVAKNKVFLLICGAYQLFGKSFLGANGRQIKGLGILNIETKAPGDQLSDRCLGNILTEINATLAAEIKKAYGGSLPSNTLVGFENHSGQTYLLDDSVTATGRVLVGKGNNAKEKLEGARYKNVFGSYLHGSMLPKNPHFADLLIYLALKNKFEIDFDWQPLKDDVEWQAHNSMRDKLMDSSEYKAAHDRF